MNVFCVYLQNKFVKNPRSAHVLVFPGSVGTSGWWFINCQSHPVSAWAHPRSSSHLYWLAMASFVFVAELFCVYDFTTSQFLLIPKAHPENQSCAFRQLLGVAVIIWDCKGCICVAPLGFLGSRNWPSYFTPRCCSPNLPWKEFPKTCRKWWNQIGSIRSHFEGRWNSWLICALLRLQRRVAHVFQWSRGLARRQH